MFVATNIKKTKEDNNIFSINKEIKSALDDNKPIVALESSMLSHGLPYPQNLEVAISLMETIKKTDSTPAMIAIINGKIKVGLNTNDINLLVESNKIEKVSCHNLVISLTSIILFTVNPASICSSVKWGSILL